MGRIDRTLEQLDELSRVRPLTDREAHRLALAIKRRAEADGTLKGQKPWSQGDLRRLKQYLKRGKKPRQIAILMNRTERAVWRKIYKEGLAVGLLCPADVFTASRLRVQSRSGR